jgi:DNA-binding LytR/AlgR family response regulator
MEQKYNCLIVDDEPIARQIVRTYIAQTPSLVLAAECKNAFEALDTLRLNNTIGIVFLDINMPNLSGISMVKTMPNLPQIIFTTAYEEYAVESYELNAVDYLLKPFSFERFTKAVFKALDKMVKKDTPSQLPRSSQGHNTLILPKNTPEAPFFIKSDGKTYPISPSDILFCEAMKNYTKVYLKNGERLIPLVPLSKMETDLEDIGAGLLRVHRSFIVSKQHITAIEGNQILMGKNKVPIGEQFKESFYKMIGLK